MTFDISHRHRVCLVDHGFNLQLEQLVGGFWVFFLSHTAPGSHLWFYFLLCMWVAHWGLLPRLPWRAWVCPMMAGVEVVQLLGLQGFRQHQVLRELAARAAENIVSRRGWQPVLANMLQYSCLENPLSEREAWQATVYRVTESWT